MILYTIHFIHGKVMVLYLSIGLSVGLTTGELSPWEEEDCVERDLSGGWWMADEDDDDLR